ncbi:MAG: hypothetical protein FWE70_03970 [Oscillospiraceae bacterium]|nr:hypothetical protein [Oscillospiraceae bacterium]
MDKTDERLETAKENVQRLKDDIGYQKAEEDNLNAIREALVPETASLRSELGALIRRFAADLSEAGGRMGGEGAGTGAGAGADLALDVRAANGAAAENGTETLDHNAWAGLCERFESALAAAAEREAAAAEERDRAKVALTALEAAWAEATMGKADAEAAFGKAVTLKAERALAAVRAEAMRAEAAEAFANGLAANFFADAEDYRRSLMPEGELGDLRKAVAEHDKRKERTEAEIKRLEAETDGIEAPDMDRLREESERLAMESRDLGARRDGLRVEADRLRGALSELREGEKELELREGRYAAVRQLSDAANGRLDFETYAQASYFDRVLRAANVRLSMMSQGRYALVRTAEGEDARRRSGLGIGAFDSYTGKVRPARGLSGGESFMASLSLALGLSDVVQHGSGGVRIESMFIDEGFGSLDPEALDLAVRTLTETAGADRLIGVISHVAELAERIPRQVRIEKTVHGSRITVAQ